MFHKSKAVLVDCSRQNVASCDDISLQIKNDVVQCKAEVINVIFLLVRISLLRKRCLRGARRSFEYAPVSFRLLALESHHSTPISGGRLGIIGECASAASYWRHQPSRAELCCKKTQFRSLDKTIKSTSVNPLIARRSNSAAASSLASAHITTDRKRIISAIHLRYPDAGGIHR